MVKNIDYLKTQIGNPEGTDIPNKNTMILEMDP
jgi:fructose-bisphosphate aldolase class II